MHLHGEQQVQGVVVVMVTETWNISIWLDEGNVSKEIKIRSILTLNGSWMPSFLVREGNGSWMPSFLVREGNGAKFLGKGREW